jgi:hypothetical protein
MTSLPGKILVSAAGLAVILVLASPAGAAESRKKRKHVAARTTDTMKTLYRDQSLFPRGPVMYGNEYLGDDPDPFIRSQLLRDLGLHFGGSD